MQKKKRFNIDNWGFLSHPCNRTKHKWRVEETPRHGIKINLNLSLFVMFLKTSVPPTYTALVEVSTPTT